LNRTRNTPVEFIEEILSAYPDGAKALTKSFSDDTFEGEFPLDLACQPTHKDMSLTKRVNMARGSKEEKVIRLLMQECPWALRYRTGEEKGTWLLRVLEHHPFLGLVKDMVEQFHALASVSESDKQTIQDRIFEVVDKAEGNLPIYSAVEYYSEPEVIKYLITSFPTSVKIARICDGNFPLHSTARYNCFDETCSLLLRLLPKAVSIKNEKGMTPLHQLFLVDKHDVVNSRELWNQYYSNDQSCGWFRHKGAEFGWRREIYFPSKRYSFTQFNAEEYDRSILSLFGNGR
jgi:hypothetical protein